MDAEHKRQKVALRVDRFHRTYQMRSGEIVALIDHPDKPGELGAVTENCLYREALKMQLHLEVMSMFPPEASRWSREELDEDRKARAAIQAEKLRRGIMPDTPLVFHPDIEFPSIEGKPEEPGL